MPECAYRPGGPWRHPATGAEEADRPGNEAFLAAAGVRWTVVDAHLLLGGRLRWRRTPSCGVPARACRCSAAPRSALACNLGASPPVMLPPYPGSRTPAHQVWSRHGGYPGDPRYLDFHKRHAETGLRLWRVTDAGGRPRRQAPLPPRGRRWTPCATRPRHFPELLGGIAGLGGGVAVCPYDAELFGHWWFEGVAWLEGVLAQCLAGGPVTTTTPSRELQAHAPSARIAPSRRLVGRGGRPPGVGERRHHLDVGGPAPRRGGRRRRPPRAAAAPRARRPRRSCCCLAASDWPFLVTTGTAADYASERFRLHRDRLHELLAAAATPRCRRGRRRTSPAWRSIPLVEWRRRLMSRSSEGMTIATTPAAANVALPKVPCQHIADIELPREVQGLYELAYNLWWTWNPKATELFAAVDSRAWSHYHNPVQMLINVERRQWEHLVDNENFLEAYASLMEGFQAYMDGAARAWFWRNYPQHEGGPVAYLSMEYGVHQSLAVYSGGLGILSGDHLKSASDLAVPLVAVGLLYRSGYFQQTVDPDGHQQHTYPEYDFSRLPVRPAAGPTGRDVVVSVRSATAR
jgi:hypothetical protein